MRKFFLFFLSLYCFLTTYSQVDPTLSVGLETLTMNKGTIDVQALTEIISEKQRELKGEALKRFMFKLFPESNYTTKFYIQNCLNVLLNEKNPKVIEKEVLELTTNYALALGTTYALRNIDDSPFAHIPYYDNVKENETDLKEKIADYKNMTKRIRGKRTINNRGSFLGFWHLKSNLLGKEIKLLEETNEYEEKLNSITYFSEAKNKETLSRKKRLRKIAKRISNIKQRRGIPNNDTIYNALKNNTLYIYNYINEKKISMKDSCKSKRLLRKLKIDELSSQFDKFQDSISVWVDQLKDVIKVVESHKELVADTVAVKTLAEEINELGEKSKIENIYKLNKSMLVFFDNILSNVKDSSEKDEITNRLVRPLTNKINGLRFRQSLNSFKTKNLIARKKVAKNEDVKIPFDLSLDVVSYVLSNIEELNKKGFFKNKIDYTKGDYYLKLAQTEGGRKLKAELDVLKDSIAHRIQPYIKHYDVINDLIKNTKSKNKFKIDSLLKNQAVKLISRTSSNNKDELNLSNEITEIADRNDYLAYLKEVVGLRNKIVSIKINESLTSQAIGEVSKVLELLSSIRKSYEKLEMNDYFKNNKINIPKLNIFKDLDKIYRLNEIIPNEDNLPDEEILKKIEKINSLVKKKTVKKDIKEIINIYESIPSEFEIKNPISILDKEVLTKTKEDIELIQNAKYAIDIDEKEKGLKIEIRGIYKKLVEDEDFYKKPLEKIILKIEEKNFIVNGANKSLIDTITINRSSQLVSNLYSKFQKIYKTEKILLRDIYYIENEVSKTLVELKLRDHSEQNDIIYENLLEYTKIITPLLKIKKLKTVNLGKYDDELHTLFEFIANLNNLDKAQTFESIVDMMRIGSESVEDNLKDNRFKEGYLVFINAMKKYTLLNSSENYVELDVASFLNDLQSYFNRNDNSKFELYLSMGLNENIFLDENFKFPGADKGDEGIDNIGFASEKIGLKIRFHNFKRFNDYENVIKSDIYLNKKAPFINEWYGIVYGSGLLYSLANTATDENFDFAHIGLGTGLRFYNSLDVNVTLGFPFVKDRGLGEDIFIGLGFDIPLGEYLEKIRN